MSTVQMPPSAKPDSTALNVADLDDLEARLAGETAADEGATADLVPILAANLRRLRTRRGLSLERLSKASRVSRAMLSQIELGYSAPTINVLWRIARALEVPFGSLLTASSQPGAGVLRATQAKLLTNHDGSFFSRALFPIDVPRRTELYEVRLKPGGIERADAHAAGTTENLVVAQGSLRITAGHECFRLSQGDAFWFAADVPHVYENLHEGETVLYLVMCYATEIGGSP